MLRAGSVESTTTSNVSLAALESSYTNGEAKLTTSFLFGPKQIQDHKEDSEVLETGESHNIPGPSNLRRWPKPGFQ